MPIPPLKKRTYGYIGSEKTRDIRSHGEDGRLKRKKIRSVFLQIFTAPFQLLWFFFKKLRQLWKRLPKMKKQTKLAIIRKLLLAGITLAVFGFLGATILVAWASKDLPDPNKLTDRNVAQSTKIYDRTGEHILYEIFAEEKRTLVELDQIPDDLKQGLIATEDKLFYEHKGVRPLSILRAFIFGVFTDRRIAGTSTLTQQLIKNAFLSSDRKLSRKVKEIIMAIRLEQKYSKDEILKIYFNEIPYGSTNYGVESAAQSYLGKHVSDLTLAESALLAGFPKSPSRYLNDPEALKNRRDFVLERMYQEGYLSEGKKTAAQAEPVPEVKHMVDNIKAPHFVMHVKQELVDTYGEQTVEQGGLRVITTLDWKKQEIAETAVKDNEELLEEAGANNAALVALDPKTGQILAHVGSRDYFNNEINGQFDVVSLGKRQPGSSFKPIIYAAAFEKGYTPDTILFDVITNFAASGKAYQPQNYDLKEHGPLTMRQALQGSLNIPAVQTLYLVGEKKGVEFAERMGYSTLSQGDFGLSLVLGGGEVKLLEHARAYAIFANNGRRQPVSSILTVENSRGEKLYEWKEQNGEEALAPEIAATISNVLSDAAARAFMFGAAGEVLTLKDRPVAAKTGTTNNYVDAWTMGYTPSLVAGVWAGNTNNTPMKRGYGGNKVAGQIWNNFMKNSLKDTATENFPPLPPNTSEKPVLRGSSGGGITLSIDKVTGKRATSSTPEEYIEDRTYIQPHSILHYVLKDDPRGPTPERPETDPQYTIWETAILDWIKRKQEKEPDWNMTFQEPPEEFDDAHSLELVPTLEVYDPLPESAIENRHLATDIRVSAPRGVTEVAYFIDGSHIQTVKSHPFNLSSYVRWLQNGRHTLKITVRDDVGNALSKEIPFTLSAGEEPPDAEWILSHAIYSPPDFPRMFNIRLYKKDQIREIKIFGQQNGNEKKSIASIVDFGDITLDQAAFTWDEKPGIGAWTLSMDIIDKNGNTTAGETVKISIE